MYVPRLHFIIFLLPLFCSCSADNERTTVQAEIPTIILDTDLGNSTDDVFAIQALFAYQAENRCKVAGVMQSRKVEKAKDLLDRFMHYYKADHTPIGFVEGEEQFFEIIPYYQLVDSLKQDGRPLFEPSGIALSDRLPAWKLYRKLLSEAEDHSITIVCIGMLTNLGILIESKADEYSPLSGPELIKKKVDKLEIMAGCFNPVPLRFHDPKSADGFLEIEYNILGDVPLAKKVIEGWPGTLHILPLEEGMRFPSVHNKILEQYSSQKDSPIYQIYSRYDEWAKGDVGQYLWDVLTILHPILGEEHFSCSSPGILSIDDRGKTTFSPDSKGDAHIISFNAETAQKMWIILDRLSCFHP